MFQVKVAQGAGKFTPLPAYSAHVYSSILQREKVLKPIKVDRDSSAVAVAAPPTPVTPVQPSAPPASQAPPPVTPTPIQASPFDELPVGAKQPAAGDFHARQPTRAGGRNLQDSSFALSGWDIFLFFTFLFFYVTFFLSFFLYKAT